MKPKSLRAEVADSFAELDRWMDETTERAVVGRDLCSCARPVPSGRRYLGSGQQCRACGMIIEGGA